MDKLVIALVVFSSIVALRNWRWGLLLCIFVGIIQDPIRKITPETPPILTLAFTPIYFSMFIGLMMTTDPIWNLRRRYPQLLIPFLFFALALFGSFCQTISYGPSALMAALLGAFSYLGAIPAILLGYHYVRQRQAELDRPLLLFMGVTSLMLLGVPLEHAGVEFSQPWLGTIGMREEWRRWYTDTEWIEMISGFHRSPEIMGWHAMFMVVVSIYLAVRNPRLLPLWMALAAWGSYGVLMSGRRKMYLMVLVFTIVMILVSRGWQRSRLLTMLLIVCLAVIPLLLIFVQDAYLQTAHSGLDAAGAKAAETGITGPLWLAGIVGLFGYGVGTKTQGAQHLEQFIRTPLVEGGFEKVLVELGLLGTGAALLLLAMGLHASWSCARQARKRSDSDSIVTISLFAILVANLSSFLISFQVFGDPFIGFMLGFLTGSLLSAARMPSTKEQAVPLYSRRRLTQLLPSGTG